MGLLGRRKDTAPPGKPPVEPPVDLSVPVTNPEVVEAVLAFEADPVQTTLEPLVDALRTANLLVAMRTDGPGVEDGVMQKGTAMTIYSVLDPQDAPTLAVFTDWDALRASCGGDWSGLVQPAPGVWEWALSSFAGGAVLNPHGPTATFPMPPNRINGVLGPGTRPSG